MVMTFRTPKMTFGASEKNDTLFFFKLNIGVKNEHAIPTGPHLLTYDPTLPANMKQCPSNGSRMSLFIPHLAVTALCL